MRIGIDARLVHYRQAGISQYIIQLVKALSRCTASGTGTAHSRGDTPDQFIVLQSVRHRQPIVRGPSFVTRRLLTPIHHRLEQLTLPFEILNKKLDVLHSPDFIPPFRCKCRSVITVHDLAFMLYPHFLTKASARYYGQIDQAVRRADAIIAVSQATKRDVMRLLGVDDRKITVIYEAANPLFGPMDRHEAAQRVSRRFGVAGDFLLFVSTIEPRKNVPNLLRAFRRLLDDYGQDVRLVVVGEKGWLFDEAFDLVTELRLSKEVIFLGRVAAEELLWLYNSAQALVQPSIYEGFGLMPLEAMACGTPVVVSNVSSMPEVAGDAGLTVDPHNVDELAVAMWRILDDTELRASLIDKGVKRAACFSWDKTASETLNLYHSLI